MSEADRRHWDRRYTDLGQTPVEAGKPPPPLPLLAPVQHLFPVEGHALELACGRGRGAVWLASRGMEVWAVDISPVAIELARNLAARYDLSHRCRFEVIDLDEGLPPGPPVDLVLCYLFRDPRLDRATVKRIMSGGLLAMAVLSEVGAGPGQFRIPAGELREAFSDFELLHHAEKDGTASMLARAP